MHFILKLQKSLYPAFNSINHFILMHYTMLVQLLDHAPRVTKMHSHVSIVTCRVVWTAQPIVQSAVRHKHRYGRCCTYVAQ